MNYKHLSCLTLSLAGGSLPVFSQQKPITKPNIVIIITDQQNVNKLSYMGDPWIKTPTMDNFAKNGYVFTQSYCVFPLSVPSRFSFFTGRYPADYGVRGNHWEKSEQDMYDFSKIADKAIPTSLANLFNNAGYDTYYGGKVHLPSQKSYDDWAYYGFKNNYSEERHIALGEDAAALLKSKEHATKPFLMVVSYINPHDICNYDLFIKEDWGPKAEKGKADILQRLKRYWDEAESYPRDRFFSELCPPHPLNFERYDMPPGFAVNYGAYTEKQWYNRHWEYNRLIEEVDSDMAPVWDALNKYGFLKNTILVFTSDHGEMNGAHGMILKIAPFKEAQNIPFIVMGPGIQKGVIDRKNMVNGGIDLLPTLCDLAGIKIPADMPGLSMKPLLTGQTDDLGRHYIFTESANWYQVVKDGRYKYTIGECTGAPVLLFDLQTDPLEMTNQIDNPHYARIKDELSKALADKLQERGVTIRKDNNKNSALSRWE